MDLWSRIYQYIHRTPAVRDVIFGAQNLLATVRPRQVSVPDGPLEHYLAAVVRVKDEGRFIAEWAAHTLATGVEHIFVYDNGSTDETLDVLAPFVDAGDVTVISWQRRPAFPSCYLHFLRTHGHRAQWVAFFDADEFLVEHTPGALLRRLQATTRAPALAVNWRFYGSSSYETVPAGLVTENFLQCSPTLSRHVKVIARPRQIRRLRNAHGFYYERGRLARSLVGPPARASFVETDATDAELVLNHYYYRSREDYERKLLRGRSNAPSPGTGRTAERSTSEFALHNAETRPLPGWALAAIRARLEATAHDPDPIVHTASTSPSAAADAPGSG